MSNPLHPHHEDHPDIISRNARQGLILFLIYFALYGGFIALNIFRPAWLSETSIPLGDYEISLGGPNIAIVYGVALIFAALFLALIYMRLTKTPRS